jgi:glycosyl hydrolase family 71
MLEGNGLSGDSPAPQSRRSRRGKEQATPLTRSEARRREAVQRARKPSVIIAGGLGVALLGVVGVLLAVPGSGDKKAPPITTVAADRTASETAVTAVASATAPAKPKASAKAKAAAAADDSSSALPFDMPATSTLRASRHKVFAHWMATMPISLDNKPSSSDYYTTKYIDPNGEGGRHRAYGGFLRDRPLPVPPGGADWRLRNARTAISQATRAGVDVFAWDVQTLNTAAPAWNEGVTLMKAAEGTGFKVALTPDMGPLKTASAASMAAGMAKLAKSPSAYKLGDGRVVVMPFLGSSGSTSDYWRQFSSIMSGTYGIKVALVPIFLNEVTSMPSFGSAVYGASNWGARNPGGNPTTLVTGATPLGRAANAMKSGKIWMQPVSMQDERPRAGIFEEAKGFENLRSSWQIAIRSKSDWAQLATWNDFSEGSQFEPSVKRNWATLDLSAYYATWYKTGSAPKITRDTVYVAHRTQPHAATPSFPQSKLMKLARGIAPVNQVEATGFLTAAGSITVTSGSNSKTCSVPAGVQTCTVALAPGKVTARISRAGTVTTSVTSPFTVAAKPYVQDLQYVAASSRRTASGAPTNANSTAGSVASSSPKPAAGGKDSKSGAVENGQADGSKPGQGIDAKAITLTARGGATPATSYLRFNLPATPAGKKLVGAALRIHTTTNKGSVTGAATNVFLADNVWQEKTLSWKAKPAVTGAPLGTLAKAPAVNTTYRIPLNATTLGSLAGTQRTFAITGTSADSLLFRSRLNAFTETRPTLVLTYQ